MAAAPGARMKRLNTLLPAYGTYVAGAIPSAAIPLAAEILRRKAVSRKKELAVPESEYRSMSKKADVLKIAYGEKQHRGLAGVTARGAEASGPARGMMVEGALATDKGIRHPWLPHTDNLHSFAGSQTRAQIGSGIAARQQDAVSDISKSIAGAKGKLGVGGYLKSGVRGVRGLLNTGDTQHSLVDISSHYNKPLTQGSDTAIRGVLPKSGYGGIFVGGREHVNAEKLVRNAATGKGIGSAIAEIDDLRPSVSADDAQAVARSKRFGSATRRQVEAQLVQQHGMSPEQAARSAEDFFNRATFSDASKRVGEVSRDARYVKREAGRAAGALKGALSGVLRRGRA